MTNPIMTNPVQYYAAWTLDILDRIDQTSQAAEVTDEAGHWGVDGWIRVFHDLFDIQIRALANLTEATIEGPWWCRKNVLKPYGVDCLTVEAAPFPRKFKITKTFRRLGTDGDEPAERIPDNEIEFHPPKLAANQTHFRIVLTNSDRMGFNYRGMIKLVEDAPNPRKNLTVEQTVVVGL